MANINKPFGFRPARPLGSGGNERLNRYTIADAYNTSIYYGQYVVLTGTGRNIAVGAGTGDIPLGVFYGCEYTAAAGDQYPRFSRYWPASTAIKSGTRAYAFVLDEPMQEYVIQADGTLAEADAGLNADVTVGTGSTITGNSASLLAVSGKGTGATLLLNIIGLDDKVVSPANAWGAYARVKVRFNLSRLNYTAGI